MTVLTVDAGNTRIKWGVHANQDWLCQGWVAKADLAALREVWNEIAEPGRIIVSNVAGGETAASLNFLFSRWRAIPQWVCAVTHQCGVCNSYANPAQLGSDRWAALIAAWRTMGKACLVVNAGTAMTVDALSNEGIFLGGVIVPGLALMRGALAQNAPALKVPQGDFQAFPGNTADAIASGAIQALAGAVERMARELDPGKSPHCLISGGAAKLLAPHLNLEVKVVDNLVLEGLVLIAREGSRR